MAALARADVTVQLIVGRPSPRRRDRARGLARGPRALRLVSDAVAAAGLGDGRFTLGGTPVTAAGGAVRRADGTLAGAPRASLTACAICIALGAPLEEALEAASSVPARIAGRPDLGRLAVGAPADVVVLDDRLEVQRVLVAGSGGRGSPASATGGGPDIPSVRCISRPTQGTGARASAPR